MGWSPKGVCVVVAVALGCAASPPPSDAAGIDAPRTTCDHARDLAASGLGAGAIDHAASLALPATEQARAVPSAWTNVSFGCFDVRVDVRVPGQPFPLFVFTGSNDATYAVTDTITTLPTAAPADVGGGVRRFDFLVPASWTSAFLVQSAPCSRSGALETRRYALTFDDAASTVRLGESECVDCPASCSGVRCASPETRVATDHGPEAIASLRAGDLVWSIDGEASVLVPLVRVSRTPVSGHEVVRVVLDTGAVLEMSPGHPLAEGGTFADLRSGMRMGRARVVSATRVPFVHDATFDILPASETGTYLAEGVWVGSTLAGDASGPRRSRVACRP